MLVDQMMGANDDKRDDNSEYGEGGYLSQLLEYQSLDLNHYPFSTMQNIPRNSQ